MSSFLPQPLAMQFLGRIDRKVFDENITDKGFIVNAAHIIVSTNEKGIGSGPEVLLVTPKGIKEELQSGEICAISCKFIGSNTRRADQLHYISATKTTLGHESDLPSSLKEKAANKTAIIGLGVIMQKDIVEGDEIEERSKVFLTLKSMDYDPVTGDKAVWLTRHGVSLEMFPLGVENQYNVGDEVQLSGVVTGYDANEYMWTTEVYCLASVGIQNSVPFHAEIEKRQDQHESHIEMEYKKVKVSATPPLYYTIPV